MGKILFVCTANICRSPFAEGVLKMLLMKRKVEGIKVRSAGVFAIPGHHPPEDAVKVAREFGVDVSGHSSSPLSVEMLRSADMVAVMDLFHREKIVEMEPESEDKLRLLGSYSTSPGKTLEEMEVPDPYGFTLFHYRRSFKIIHDCTETLCKELLE